LVYIVHRRTLVTVAATTLIVGCEAIDKKTHAIDLDKALKTYTGAMRWGNFDTAAAYAAPRAGPNAVNPAGLAGIKVTAYEIRINSVSENVDEASVHLSFTFYDENRGTVGAVDQDAIWYLDEQRQGWLMDDSLPRFDR
jgi:hypothetical protein